MYIFFKDRFHRRRNDKISNQYIDTTRFSEMQVHWELSMVGFTYPHTFKDTYTILPFYFRNPEIATSFYNDIADGLKQGRKAIDLTHYDLMVPEYLYWSMRGGDIIEDAFIDTITLNHD